MRGLITGLASVSFRDLDPRSVVYLTTCAGLSAIEWGGDIHVPHGDVMTAREVARMTRDAGLQVSSYGSYYRVGSSSPALFQAVVDTAEALGARLIRVWAGQKTPSAEASEATKARIFDDGSRIADIARQAGLALTLEWHGDTLTDTAESARELLDALPEPTVGTYWQTRSGYAFEDNLRDMDAARPRLRGVHVHWLRAETGERQPLREGRTEWLAYLEKATTSPGETPLYALIEFVRDNAPHQLADDAACLNDMISEMVTGTSGGT